MTAPLRNHDVAELRRLDVAHHLPCQNDYRIIAEQGGSRIITRAEGCTIYDGDGNAMLDGMAGLWCVNVGYGREALARAAHDQMLELSFYNTFFRTATPPTIRLATKLAELMGGALRHVFFNNSGSEAIDTVVRMARHYWALKGEPQRTIFISRFNAYHGSTVAGASLGGMAPMHTAADLPIPGVEHVMQPYLFGETFGEAPDAFATRAAEAVERRILEVGPEKVAAFIGEPVQGAGGVIIPPDGYWPRVETICRKYGVLLVCDEVICGFGRLGAWFGHHLYGVKPDMVTMAKGLSSGYLPISAVGVADHIVDVFREKGGEFVHGYTYSGHPTCAAVALKNLEIIEAEGLVERVRDDIGPYFGAALASLAAHPLVGEVRTIGLMAAVEIVSQKGTNHRFTGREGRAGPVVRDLCIENGLMVRAVRDSIVAAPPLVISREEVDRMVDILRRALDAAEPILRTAAASELPSPEEADAPLG